MTNGQFFGGLMLAVIFALVWARIAVDVGVSRALKALGLLCISVAWILVAVWLIVEGSK